MTILSFAPKSVGEQRARVGFARATRVQIQAECLNEQTVTFKSLFCARFRCADADYESLAFRKIFYKRWLPLAFLLHLLNAPVLRTERKILGQIAVADTLSTFNNEAARIKEDYLAANDFGLLRRFFKFRISGKRLLRLGADLWPKTSTKV